MGRSRSPDRADRDKKKKKRRRSSSSSTSSSSPSSSSSNSRARSRSSKKGAHKDQVMTDEQKARLSTKRPLTKEEYEARQSVIRRVVDHETGRTRLVRGEGEIIEEMVSKEKHKEINKQATKGDGNAFQRKLGVNRFFLPLTAQQSRERNLNRGRIIYEHIQRLIYSSGITRGKPYPKFPK
ncbi:hypothetical protein F2P81_013950 [Scophthalmus maximus]|uniref:ADP-ribosylation factor-like protein 6-interacting protein 4 n=1 Tax=Scophthalmus maximus TaxID=52904 RepID=A0A6A4SS62_SCOMX|nr:hypothetical protein F2P81_013950 [Scophthalmus maximus]